MSDVFLVPLDPQRALPRITHHLERYGQLDLKLAEALETTFSPESLRALVREAHRLEAAESTTGMGAAAELRKARDELRQMTPVRSIIVVSVLTGIGLAALQALAEGAILQPPPPPRPTGPNRPD